MNHSLQTANHNPFADTYADATDRLAATGFPRGIESAIVPFATADIGKLALQSDDNSIWMLTAITPTWFQITGTGSLGAAVAGAGLSISGGVLAVNVDNSTIEISSDTLRAKDAGITDAKLATSYTKADGTRAFTGDQSMGAHRITNVTDPSSAQDAATKAYVDSQVSGATVSDEHIQDVVGVLLADGDVDFSYDDSGATETNIVRKASENFALPGDISPAQLTANTNDWNPTGLSTASAIRLSTDAARDITGLQDGADGRLMILHNIGSQNAVLKDESSSSSAANRFALNADVTLGADQSALLQYDSTSSRWRLVAGPSAGGGGGSIAPLQLTNANTVEQYNGTTPQTFRVYGTRTSSTNYEALKFSFDSGNGAFAIEAEKGSGGGSFRRLFLLVSSGIYQFNSGSFEPPGDNSQTLGGSSHYWSQVFGNDYIAVAGGKFRWAGRTRMLSPDDGYIKITTDGGNPGTIANTARTLTQITSNQNNYDIAVPSYFLRASSDASRDITGMIVSNTTRQDGETHVFVNVGTQNIVLKHEDAGSTAANRFLCSTGADITLSANQAADLIYDGTTQRWRVFKRN